MIELKDIFVEGKAYEQQVFDLYEEAFPVVEKKPQQMLRKLVDSGRMEILAVTEGEEFIGLVMNLMYERAAILDYFAITPSKRGGGYGGQVIRRLLNQFEGKKYIFEIEMQDPAAENALERSRRKQFYLRNGLRETGVLANVYDTDFELLTPDGELTYEEYVRVLYDLLGADVVAHIKPRKLNV